MLHRTLRSSFLAVAGIVAAAVMAALAGPAQAACYSTVQALPQADIDAFLGNAADILKQNPDGGPAMIARIRDLAASNPATLPVIIGLLANAGINANQKTAIGTGLGQAAQVCVRGDQAYAAEIQRLVGLSGSPEAITALAAVIGDRPIGGLGGGGGGGAGGVSGGAGGPTNSFTPPSGGTGTGTLATSGTSGTQNSFTGSTAAGTSAGSSSTTTTTTTTTTTLPRSVSP
jgi:hypothetical protein